MAESLYDHPEFYDLLAPGAAASDFYWEEAVRAAGPVLELACGTGQLAIPIAKAGINITGLDSSEAMLAHARNKATREGVMLRLSLADMREFQLGRKFKLIFVANNSLQHLLTSSEFSGFFRSVRAHLAQAGVVAFDVFNPSLSILSREPGVRHRIGQFHGPDSSEIIVQETTEYDAATQISKSTWYWSKEGAPDFRVTPLQLRSIFPQELPVLLSAHGIRLEQRFGDFNRRGFVSSSPKQVCLCRAV